MAEIAVSGLTKRFGATAAVDAMDAHGNEYPNPRSAAAITAQVQLGPAARIHKPIVMHTSPR